MVVIDTYNQFLIDAPRVCVFLDNQKVTYDNADKLFVVLVHKYEPLVAIKFMYYCTQTFLADIYIQKAKELTQVNRDFQLVDDGAEVVSFDKRGVYILKPFKVCVVDDAKDLSVYEKLFLEIKDSADNINTKPTLHWSSEWHLI